MSQTDQWADLYTSSMKVASTTCMINHKHETIYTQSMITTGDVSMALPPEIPHQHGVIRNYRWCDTHQCPVDPNDYHGRCALGRAEDKVVDIDNRLRAIERRLDKALAVLDVQEKLEKANAPNEDVYRVTQAPGNKWSIIPTK